ncbi:MAG: hypothetical protein RMM08_08140 [Armatimonadota bacterium]|nr:hypothetical protein [Armatimonadota bacterium]
MYVGDNWPGLIILRYTGAMDFSIRGQITLEDFGASPPIRHNTTTLRLSCVVSWYAVVGCRPADMFAQARQLRVN